MAMRSRRRSTMSATAPAGNASSIIGMLSAASTSATIDGEDESEVINQPAPTSCIQVPTFETIVAIHRLRKSAFRRGLQAEDTTRVGSGRAESIECAGFIGRLYEDCRAWLARTSANPTPRPRRSGPASRITPGQSFRSSELHHELIDVAPAPVLSAFERGDDRMLGRAEMLRGVLVLRIVAAPDVTAGPAQAKMHPRFAGGEAFLAAGGVGRVRHYKVEMAAP